ncbi:hypothetical protein ACW95P_00550 [Candidatus Mycoplasma pogonae]
MKKISNKKFLLLTLLGGPLGLDNLYIGRRTSFAIKLAFFFLSILFIFIPLYLFWITWTENYIDIQIESRIQAGYLAQEDLNNSINIYDPARKVFYMQQAYNYGINRLIEIYYLHITAFFVGSILFISNFIWWIISIAWSFKGPQVRKEYRIHLREFFFFHQVNIPNKK